MIQKIKQANFLAKVHQSKLLVMPELLDFCAVMSLKYILCCIHIFEVDFGGKWKNL